MEQNTSSEEQSKLNIVNDDAANYLKKCSPASVDVIFTSPDPMRTNADFYTTLNILGAQTKRVLKPAGSMWVHMEDFFNEQGSLQRYPARFSVDMVHQHEWILRAERIWHMPVGGQNFYNEGRVIDDNRLILDHSYVFHFTNAHYGYYNTFDEFGGQPCSIFTEKQRDLGPDEYATAFSMELVKQCLLMSAPTGATIMDPFTGSGTTGAVALAMKDKNYTFIGVEKDIRKIGPTTERLNKIV